MYGIFRICAKYKKHKEEFLYGIFLRFCLASEEHIHSLIAHNAKNLAADKNDLGLKSFLYACRDYQKQQSRLSLSHTFTTKYIIHKCDENGLVIPSKKELEDACITAMNMLSYEAISDLIAKNKIKQEYLKYFI